jgi:hypothetical protein
MRLSWFSKHRLPFAVLAATLILTVYLMLATAQGTVQSNRMLVAIFRYGLAPGLVATYALRSSLVWLLAFSMLWCGFSLVGERGS